jgi:predicted histidine transporter YuiF (NhaC family)
MCLSSIVLHALIRLIHRFQSDAKMKFSSSLVTLIRCFSSSAHVVIPVDIEFIGAFCSYAIRSISSLSFEDRSALKCISCSAFISSSLRSIVIPPTVNVIAGSAFHFADSPAVHVHPRNQTFAMDRSLLIFIAID